MSEPASILVIDDDTGVTKTLSSMITRMGHKVQVAHSIQEGLKAISQGAFDAVFLDVQLPDGNGLDIIRRLKAAPTTPQVIIITSYAHPDGAEIAIENGAWDFIEKPISLKKITLLLMRVLEFQKERKARKESLLLKQNSIIGKSPQIQSCLDLAARAASSDANVLITGETGTGKELFAKLIHDNSSRAGENFVVVDCGVLTETMVESVLFGHEKGAYTGADKERIGLIRLADKGTLFLDEVGELPGQVQASFLRVLQEHRFRPMGARKEISSDFRSISATNKNLDQLADSGAFRKDLLYRLRSIVIELPPLRDRKQDIPDLVETYLIKICNGLGLMPKKVSVECMEMMADYGWPGNVRELVGALESAIATAQKEPTIFAQYLPKRIRIDHARAKVSEKTMPNHFPASNHERDGGFPTLKNLVETTEKKYFQMLVNHTQGNIRSICQISGLSRAMVYTRLKKYQITRKI